MRKGINVTMTAAAVIAASASMSAQTLGDLANAVNPVKHFERAVETVSRANDVVQVVTAPAQVPTQITQELVPGVHINPMNPFQPPRVTTLPGAQRAWENLPRTIDNSLSPGAAALAQAIRIGERNAAMSAQPVPAWVQQALAGSVSPNVLYGARMSFNWGATANGTLQQLALSTRASAITLNTVIVFRVPDEALVPNRDNLEQWRHELTHVEQYQREGIDGFAAWYMRDVNRDLLAGRDPDPQLEKDARAVAAAAVARIAYGSFGNAYAGYTNTRGGYAVNNNNGGGYAGYNSGSDFDPPAERMGWRKARRNYDAPSDPVYQPSPAPKPRPSWMPTVWGDSK
jgi:hypothetical protein